MKLLITSYGQTREYRSLEYYIETAGAQPVDGLRLFNF